MNFDQFAKTLGGAALPPTDNILGASYGPLLSNYAKASFLNNAAGSQVGGRTVEAQIAKKNQDDQANFAKKQKIEDLSAQAEAIKKNAEGKDYKKVQKEDGGFDFLDALGNKIPVQQYAKATGKTVQSVLKGSDNSLDIQYTNHHKMTEELVNALVNGDKKSRDKLYQTNPGLKEATRGLTGEQIIQQFQKAYPHIYGDGSAPQTGLQPLSQDISGRAPQPPFNIFRPQTYAPAAGQLFGNLASTLSGD